MTDPRDAYHLYIYTEDHILIGKLNIDVEFTKELVEITKRNIERSHCNAEVTPKVLRPVLRSLQEVSKGHKVCILYLNAENSTCVEEFATKFRKLPDGKVFRFEQQPTT